MVATPVAAIVQIGWLFGMLRYDEADLVTYVAAHSSAVALALDDTSDEVAAVAVRVSPGPFRCRARRASPRGCCASATMPSPRR
jgi:hypothetical protein